MIDAEARRLERSATIDDLGALARAERVSVRAGGSLQGGKVAAVRQELLTRLATALKAEARRRIGERLRTIYEMFGGDVRQILLVADEEALIAPLLRLNEVIPVAEAAVEEFSDLIRPMTRESRARERTRENVRRRPPRRI